MAADLDPKAIADELRQRFVGSEPPTDLVGQVGGWRAIEAVAPALVDEPLLAPTLMLLVRDMEQMIDSGDDVAVLLPAAGALARAAVASSNPGLFATSVELLCSSAAFVGLLGDQLSAVCLPLAIPARIDGVETSEAEALRHAVALESAARLAVIEPKSRHEVLAVLTKVTEPQPVRYARAVSRTVAVAYDHWNAAEGADDVADVLDILIGVTPPSRIARATPESAARDMELVRDIAADATWAKANVDIARALRAGSALDLIDRLDDALESLTFVMTQDERPDALLLKSSLGLLRGLLESLSKDAGPHAAEAWVLALEDVQSLGTRARELLSDAHRLNHWHGDRKVIVLSAWARFVASLGELRDQLDRESIYNAATVLDDILTIYRTTNSYDVLAPGHGVERVVRVIRPAIAKGFAARSGLFRNLNDHTEALRQRVKAIRNHVGETPGSSDGTTAELARLEDQLSAAETVLAAAKSSLEAATAEPPGKQLGQAPKLPRLLADLLGLDANALVSIADLESSHLETLSAALADRQAGTDLDPDPILNAVRKEALSVLSGSPDFADETAAGITEVLDQLIKFIAARQNVQASWRPYLYRPGASEDDLHQDLHGWLMGGHLRSATNVEAQHVGGGRIDLMVTFAGFHLYIELKEDSTQVPLTDKVSYLKQTIAYQASGVRIGFLVVLRSKAGKGAPPQPHLSELVTHTILEATVDAPERHVVMLELPGDRTAPSQM